jgi:uncharacterized MnhB-related membrane protein|nr:DUF4040 domain-containing protein [Jatrophihabitans sp.]
MSFWVIDYLCLAGVLACGVLVVVLRNANAAVMALSAMGVLLTVVFVVLGAPDVAHAEIVVGAIVLPTLYLVAIGKIRAQVEDRRDLGEDGARDE